MRSLRALPLAGLLASVVMPSQAGTGTAYVALCCSAPATISVLDAASGVATAEFPAGVGAAVMAPTPDYRSIYALTQLNQGVPGEPWGGGPGSVNSIVVLDMPDGRPSTVIPLSAMPFAIAFSPGGAKAYVVAVDSSYGSHLFVVDTQTKQVIRDRVFPKYLFGPQMQMVMSPDGSLLYMLTYAGVAIWKIDTQSLDIINKFHCSLYCQGLALVDQDKTLLTVANLTSVYYIDAGSMQLTQQLPWPLPVGNYAGWVIPVSPDGNTAYIGGNPYSTLVGSLAGLSIADATFTFVLTGMGIFQVGSISPDGRYLVTDTAPTTLSILRLTPPIASQPRDVITLSEIGAAFFSATGDQVYVLNEGSSYVAQIDVRSGHVIGRIPVGAKPVSLAADPAYHQLYVVNAVSPGISVIDTPTSKVMQNVAVYEPEAVAAAGANVFVAQTEGLQLFSPQTGTLQQLIFPHVGHFSVFEGFAVSPDQQQLYVAYRSAASETAGIPDGVAIYDATTGALVNQIAVPGAAQVAFGPDGVHAYVGSLARGQPNALTVIDTSSQTITSTIPLPADQNINSLAVTPDGRNIYVLDMPTAMVYAVDLATGQIAANIPVGVRPTSLAISPDGTVVYVTDSGSASISVIATATNQVVDTIAVGTGSTAVTFLAE